MAETIENNVNDAQEPTTPQTIDWNAIDVSTIPLDVIKKHQFVNDLTSESISRRKKLDELKAQLEDKPAVEEVPTTGDPLQDKLAKLEASINTLTESLSEREQTLQVTQLVKDHKLNDENAKLLKDLPADQRAKVAPLLAQAQISASNVSASNGGGEPADALSALKTAVRNRLKGGIDETNAFDPDMQRQMGGGSVTRN